MTGPNINRIAVFVAVNDNTERWYPQDLREPVASATPVMGNACVAYVLGRRVYAFSATTKTWDVLELDLAQGIGPHLEQPQDLQSFKVRFRSHVYTFRFEDGKWKDLDLNAILEGKQPFEKKIPNRAPGDRLNRTIPNRTRKLKVDSE